MIMRPSYLSLTIAEEKVGKIRVKDISPASICRTFASMPG
jgi:hypothetical protein